MSIHFRTRTVSYNLPLDTMFGACCTDNSCAETTAASCYENPNGRFFHNLSCDDIICEFGVCCNNGLCSETSEEGCIAQGGEFIGKEYNYYFEAMNVSNPNGIIFDNSLGPALIATSDY